MSVCAGRPLVMNFWSIVLVHGALHALNQDLMIGITVCFFSTRGLLSSCLNKCRNCSEEAGGTHLTPASVRPHSCAKQVKEQAKTKKRK